MVVGLHYGVTVNEVFFGLPYCVTVNEVFVGVFLACTMV